MTNTETYTHELLTRDWGFLRIINYRGCFVQKIHNGYIVFGNHVVDSPEAVDKVIDSALDSLGKSIKQ